MKKRSWVLLVQLILPAIVMFVLAYIAFSSADDLFTTGFILNSLIVYYPLLFLLQGIVCALLQSNIFISLGVSVVAFIIVLFVWLNSSAAIYIIAYVIVWFIGYGLTQLVKKMMRK